MRFHCARAAGSRSITALLCLYRQCEIAEHSISLLRSCSLSRLILKETWLPPFEATSIRTSKPATPQPAAKVCCGRTWPAVTTYLLPHLPKGLGLQHLGRTHPSVFCMAHLLPTVEPRDCPSHHCPFVLHIPRRHEVPCASGPLQPFRSQCFCKLPTDANSRAWLLIEMLVRRLVCAFQ
jgi:hypothetical protein